MTEYQLCPVVVQLFLHEDVVFLEAHALELLVQGLLELFLHLQPSQLLLQLGRLEVDALALLGAPLALDFLLGGVGGRLAENLFDLGADFIDEETVVFEVGHLIDPHGVFVVPHDPQLALGRRGTISE